MLEYLKAKAKDPFVLINAFLLLAAAVCFHLAMTSDNFRLCNNDATAHANC